MAACRDLQQRTGGITEFVPLPFVHMEAPLFRKGAARRGPTLREALLMHAVARLALFPWVDNLQARSALLSAPQSFALLGVSLSLLPRRARLHSA